MLVAVADRRSPPAVAAAIATHAVVAIVPVFIRARRQRPAWWRQQLDCLPHDLTPLPVQAGEDAAEVHPAPKIGKPLEKFGKPLEKAESH